MDTILTVVAFLVLMLMLAPVAMLALTFFVLVPLAHVMPAAPMLARARFNCPFWRRPVTAAFVTAPGRNRPTDVASCSRFGDGKVTCGKGCLDLTKVGEAPSPLVARFSLLSDGTAPR